MVLLIFLLFLVKTTVVKSEDGIAIDSYYEELSSCPASSNILPCTCDGPHNFLLFQCDRITETYSISRATALEKRNFGKFSLTNSRILSLESNVLGSIQFEYIFLRKNTVKKIGKEFFDSSRDTLIRIEIIHNDVEKFPFKELSSYSKLEHINLKYNSIKSIPDEAFGTIVNNKIKQIDLSFNKINHIGANAFKYLTRLEKLDIRYNKLTVINNLAFSAFTENSKLMLHLENNKIMFVAEGAFRNQVFKSLNLTDNNLTTLQKKAFLGVIERMAERRTGTISLGKNRFRCTCDKVEWILHLETPFQLLLLDFECSDKDNKPLQDIILRDLGCKDH